MNSFSLYLWLILTIRCIGLIRYTVLGCFVNVCHRLLDWQVLILHFLVCMNGLQCLKHKGAALELGSGRMGAAPAGLSRVSIVLPAAVWLGPSESANKFCQKTRLNSFWTFYTKSHLAIQTVLKLASLLPQPPV